MEEIDFFKLLTKEEIEKVQKQQSASKFKHIINIQKDSYKEEIEKKKEEIKTLTETLKYIKEFTKTGPRKPKA